VKAIGRLFQGVSISITASANRLHPTVCIMKSPHTLRRCSLGFDQDIPSYRVQSKTLCDQDTATGFSSRLCETTGWSGLAPGRCTNTRSHHRQTCVIAVRDQEAALVRGREGASSPEARIPLIRIFTALLPRPTYNDLSHTSLSTTPRSQLSSKLWPLPRQRFR